MGRDRMTVSLWQDIPYIPRPALEGNVVADSIVLGAGMTGLGLAHFLAQRGIRTLMIEGDRVAGGASGRNIGFVLSGLGEHYAGSVEYWGRPTVPDRFRECGVSGYPW